LIIADGEDVRDLVPDDERIRLIHLAETRSIGEKRNFGCERANGEIICHWDDDDWSGPARIDTQCSHLFSADQSRTSKTVAGFHSLRFTDGERWWQYIGTKNYALGTSLCYRKDWWAKHPFRQIQVAEDNHFVAEAHASRQLVTADAGDLMYATIHPGNTSPRTFGSNFKLIA
jgi:glycosyltransferase involved in cell wall biosynthesis